MLASSRTVTQPCWTLTVASTVACQPVGSIVNVPRWRACHKSETGGMATASFVHLIFVLLT